MKGIIGLAALVSLLSFSAHPVLAQQRPTSGVELKRHAEEVLDRSGVVAAVDSVVVASSPELERALGELGTALNGLASRIAEDPQLRRSALQAARGMLGVAQIVVAEQSRVLQDVLRTTADEIESRPAARRTVPDRE